MEIGGWRLTEEKEKMVGRAAFQGMAPLAIDCHPFGVQEATVRLSSAPTGRHSIARGANPWNAARPLAHPHPLPRSLRLGGPREVCYNNHEVRLSEHSSPGTSRHGFL